VLALVFAAMAPAILLVRRHELPATFRPLIRTYRPTWPSIHRELATRDHTFITVASIERLGIIKGRQDIDNLVSAKRFVLIRRASNPGLAGANRVAWCKVRWVNGVRRAVVRTRGGARWALIRLYVDRYYMWWACTSGKSGCPSSPPL